jgi:hypothetical protein
LEVGAIEQQFVCVWDPFVGRDEEVVSLVVRKKILSVDSEITW